MSLIYSSVSTNFDNTPDGNIFEKDIKDVFSMLIICLKLTNQHTKFKLTKSYPYSFTINNALATMSNLSISIDLSGLTTNLSYTINSTLGLDLLHKFYSRKLLHSPADRTRSSTAPKVLLQPTPKGVAIVDEFCSKIGMSILPEILSSSFNSMDLIQMDRDFQTDKIIYSEYFINLLFIRMLGDRVNVWGLNNKPEEIKSKTRVEIASYNTNEVRDTFNFLSLSDSLSCTQITSSHSAKNITTPTTTSPFHHRFFTNPESDSHIQYYVSTSGVRVFKDKIFEFDDGTEVVVNFCFSGKAIIQWLTDCCDFSCEQGLEIAQLYLKYKLLYPVRMRTQNSSHTNSTIFYKDRNSFYCLSQLGKKICNWKEFNGSKCRKVLPSQLLDQGEDVESISSSLSTASDQKISMKAILKDQGLKYLFKKHLESEFCGENLDAYLQLKDFGSKKDKLGKLLIIRKKLRERENGLPTGKVKFLGPSTDQVIGNNISSIASIKFIITLLKATVKDPSDLSPHQDLSMDTMPKYLTPNTQSFHFLSQTDHLNKQITDTASSCLTLAYQIFFTYLSTYSPYTLNIDYRLKVKINELMMHPNTSISQYTQNVFLKTPDREFETDIVDERASDQTTSKGLSELEEKSEALDLMVNSLSNSTTTPPSLTSSLARSLAPTNSRNYGSNSGSSSGITSDQIASTTLANSDETISGKFSNLARISMTFDEILNQIYKLMEMDSIPKFLNSDLYKSSTANIEIRR
jgi:hypothetical protein